ncbi:MAG: CAP domain-containing protein, partial [Ferruginibacter sp.]
MKKRLLFLLVSSPVVLFAQAWDNDSYLKWNEKNFRKNPAFKAKIQINHPDYRLLNAAVFFMCNEIRVKNGKIPNTFSPLLEASAFHHSRSMVEQSFFSHTNPHDVTRKTSTDRGKMAGIENPHIAEN